MQLASFSDVLIADQPHLMTLKLKALRCSLWEGSCYGAAAVTEATFAHMICLLLKHKASQKHGISETVEDPACDRGMLSKVQITEY